LGAKPCNSISGKPTLATVPPSFTVRLAAMGSGATFYLNLKSSHPLSISRSS
jgi:hypothetical protein